MTMLREGDASIAEAFFNKKGAAVANTAHLFARFGVMYDADPERAEVVAESAAARNGIEYGVVKNLLDQYRW